MEDSEDKSKTVAGTNEYLPPECVKKEPYDTGFDWWTFGVLCYELVVGHTPFFDSNEAKMYQKICEDEVKFPNFIEKKVSPEFKDLIIQLLTKNKAQRLGADEVNPEVVKHHAWFKGVNFDAILKKKILAPIKPKVKSLVDLTNFDKDNIQEDPLESDQDENKLVFSRYNFDEFDFVKDKSDITGGSSM